ncbi:MAG TPA: divergent polysaccharide deacetylase family protein [Caulobacteraceae bacterium]|nr:divergent polysaccharide deacetylase family protein [Caulobacteraceae bacterium]
MDRFPRADSHTMFAKKPATPPPSRPPPTGAPAWLNPISNPYLGAGGAGLLLLASAAALILVAGDPHAGAPKIRIALQSPNAKLPAGPMRGTAGGLLGDLGPGGVTLDTLAPGQDVLMPGAPDPLAPVTGEAIITLPQGGTMGAGGAAPRTAAPRVVGPPLPAAPIAGLSAPGPGGLLPVIGKDGKTPFQAYARPFKDSGKPRIGLVVGGLGLNAAATRAAIERLPAEVTLSFVPYSDGLQGWIDLARADGHEVMLEIPMEPLDYPNNDPGPYTLMASARPEETVKRLEWLLARATGYYAVTNYLGGRFLTAEAGMGAFLGALKTRGLGFVDDGSAPKRANPGLPRASADTVVDEQLSGEAIDRQLLALEAAALQRGQSLGAGFAYPVTIEAVLRWSQGLAGRGYQLAPASAIARR